jgi:hypothetical protein
MQPTAQAVGESKEEKNTAPERGARNLRGFYPRDRVSLRPSCEIVRLHGIIESMRNRLVFAFFAAAILLSMVREWSAPAVCARSILIPANTASSGR